MTNKQYLVITEIKRQLNLLVTAGTLKYVGEYPDDLGKTGQRMPYVIVQDGDESEYALDTGRAFTYYMTVNLYLACEMIPNKTRQQDLLDKQIAICNQLTKDLTLSGTCVQAFITDIAKGDETQLPFDAGYSGSLATRKIVLRIEMTDERSS
jgi:hypothetical protein